MNRQQDLISSLYIARNRINENIEFMFLYYAVGAVSHSKKRDAQLYDGGTALRNWIRANQISV